MQISVLLLPVIFEVLTFENDFPENDMTRQFESVRRFLKRNIGEIGEIIIIASTRAIPKKLIGEPRAGISRPKKRVLLLYSKI